MMKLESEISTRGSGNLKWTAEWCSDGWVFNNTIHRNIKTKADGSSPGGGLWDFHQMLTNEIAYGPEACSHVLEMLWEDIKSKKVGPEKAIERWENLCKWISATTDAAPEDAQIYY